MKNTSKKTIYITEEQYNKIVNISENNTIETLSVSELNKMPKGNIFQDRLAPEYFDDTKNDIIENGIKQPIKLQYYVKDNQLRIADGHHRLQIANELGINKVPVIISVIYNRHISDYNANRDIKNKNPYYPPKPLNIDKYIERDYFPSEISVKELGFGINENTITEDNNNKSLNKQTFIAYHGTNKLFDRFGLGQISDRGFDGIILPDSDGTVFIAFSPKNIKSFEYLKANNENKIKEMAYPSSFNMEEFKKLTTFSKRKQYCDDRLQRIGSGSSRIAYKIDNEKVLKLAKNNKGLAQNEAEVDIAGAGYYATAEVFEYDNNNCSFLEMELVRKCNPSDFKRILGFSTDELFCYLYDIHVKKYNEPKFLNNDKLKEYMDENGFVVEVMDLVGTYGLHIGDLRRISSYGIVKRDGQDTVVLIDFGGTKDVIKNYYS